MQLRPIAAAAVLFALACSEKHITEPRLGTITITADASEVYEDDLVTLHATVRDPNGTVIPNAQVTWTSSNENIATVTDAGLVGALIPGRVVITARHDNLTSTYTIDIRRLTVLKVSVLGLPTSLSSGDIVVFGVKVEGEGGRVVLGRLVTLASTNPNVALIDPAGRVRAVSAGTATISATADGVSGTLNIAVTSDPATLNLRRRDGNTLPTLVGTRTVGAETRELYLEWGSLRLTGGAQPTYQTELHYAEYSVTTAGGQRQLELRSTEDVRDHGTVQYDGRGDLVMTSTLTSGVSHQADSGVDGFTMQYRVPDASAGKTLFFRREPI